MGHRCLTIGNAWSALKDGNAVECFLGSCKRNGIPGVRRASITLVGEVVQLRVFDSADRASFKSLGLYEFGPLDPFLSLGDADEISVFPTLEACVSAMRARWPKRGKRLLKEGVLQDEYRDYIAGGRRD